MFAFLWFLRKVARNSHVNLLCFSVSTLEIATIQDDSRNGSEGNYVRHWGVARNEAGAGSRVEQRVVLEELERAHPVDDELDADDEDQEAHDAHDRADSGGTQLVDPGRAVAQ